MVIDPKVPLGQVILLIAAIFKTPLRQYARAFCLNEKMSNSPKLLAKPTIKFYIRKHQ